MQVVSSERVIAERQAPWLREVYNVTPAEAQDSPPSVREEMHAAWLRYWRNECEHGRGVLLAKPTRVSGTRRVA